MSGFDEQAVLKICYAKCPGATREEVELFEKTTDFQNIPSSQPLKCFIHCIMEETNAIHPNTTRINMGMMMEELNKVNKTQQEIIFAMSKGCMKRVRLIKDPLEFAYALNVCCKQNDNDVRMNEFIVVFWVIFFNGFFLSFVLALLLHLLVVILF